MTGAEISAIPKEARGFQGQSAGVVTRVVANTIDAAVVGVMVGSIYLGVVSVKFLLDPLSFTWPSAHLLASLTVTLGMATFYLFVCWWLFGRSYGGHVMGLRVVGRRGRRLGPLRSLMRAAFCVFFPIGLFWCVISPQRRSVQDIVLWTRVVYDWMPRPGASQRKTLLGEAPMAMEPPVADEPPTAGAAPSADASPTADEPPSADGSPTAGGSSTAGGSPTAGESPDRPPPATPNAPARRSRWSRTTDASDD